MKLMIYLNAQVLIYDAYLRTEPASFNIARNSYLAKAKKAEIKGMF